METAKKLEALKKYLGGLSSGGLCVAFSGGVDSAVILALAVSCGGNVHAVTMHTPLHSPGEPGAAGKMAAALGAAHTIITLDVLDKWLADNPPDRCYICKRWIFSTIQEYAEANNITHVLDGTNADDLNEYRPGLRALSELGIKSPLAELGITKREVREIAGMLGLEAADKPSSPCLATRFPYNTPLDQQQMRKADEMEIFVKDLGIRVTRARVHGGILRLEVLPESFEKIISKRDSVIEKARGLGFDYVTLDLEGFRSGSMDAPILKDPQNKGGANGYKGAS